MVFLECGVIKYPHHTAILLKVDTAERGVFACVVGV